MLSTKIPEQVARWIHGQGCPADEKHVCRSDGTDCLFYRLFRQGFLIENHVRLDQSAAVWTVGNALRLQNPFRIVAGVTAFTVIPVNTAVQFINRFTASHLMQPVNVLRDNGGQNAFLLQFGEFFVGSVGLCG